MIYQFLRDAILHKRQVVCIYNGLRREVCPHMIGVGKDGSEMVLSYQFAGQSSKGLPAGGEWRCMRVADINDATSRVGEWHTGDNHSRPQTCVKLIDLEVQL